MFLLNLSTEKLYSVYCTFMHFSFMTSHDPFFILCKSKSNIFVFLGKKSKLWNLKSNMSRMAWQVLAILVSFFRIFSALSYKINLFWRCSSLLRSKCKKSWIFKDTRTKSLNSRRFKDAKESYAHCPTFSMILKSCFKNNKSELKTGYTMHFENPQFATVYIWLKWGELFSKYSSRPTTILSVIILWGERVYCYVAKMAT